MRFAGGFILAVCAIAAGVTLGLLAAWEIDAWRWGSADVTVTAPDGDYHPPEYDQAPDHPGHHPSSPGTRPSISTQSAAAHGVQDPPTAPNQKRLPNPYAPTPLAREMDAPAPGTTGAWR